MYEPTANTRTRDALRTAHQQRAQAFARMFRVFR
jgi:hypothetical protein